jgi:hypothetical protein
VDALWTGSFWEHLTAIIGIKRSLTTAYHPQADGQSKISDVELGIVPQEFANSPGRVLAVQAWAWA